jgi:hypothetical protein
MLYKNDELYKMTAADHKYVKQRFPVFPIKLTYPDSRIKPSKSKHNRLPDKPNSISFPMSAPVKSKMGTESWRYAENRIIGTNGRVIWSPTNLVIRSMRLLQEEDIELIFWLIKCCPFLEEGDNFNGRVPKCAIEDLVGKAEKKATKEADVAKMKALIYAPDIGLSEKELRTVAKAYFISGVDDLSHAQVKLAVETMVNRDKREGIKNFLNLVDADAALKVRSSIQRAIDKEVITYMVDKRTWAWVTPQGEKNEPICQITAGNEPHQALYDYFLGDKQFATELATALTGSKVVASKTADVPGPEE